MKIAGIQKLTLTDFPGHTACIIFTQGCNYKCPFCQNSELIPFNLQNLSTQEQVKNGDEILTEQDKEEEENILDFIKKRSKMLEGVVITGGEPLLQPDLQEFIKKIKQENSMKIKLDTNGSNPEKLRQLISMNAIDYVAMDVKNNWKKYGQTIGIKNPDLNSIKQSIELLKNSNIEYEFRTTIAKELHSYKDIEEICEHLGKDCNYYLQNFEDSEKVPNHLLHGFSKEELKEIEKNLKNKFPNVKVRGI